MTRIITILFLFLSTWAGAQHGMLLAKPAAGGVAELTVTDSLKIWLKTDAGITTGTGGVSTWADQSGNGYDFSQATTENRPDYGTATQNGYSSVTFNGSSDYMQSTATLNDVLLSGTDVTAFAVMRGADATANTLVSNNSTSSTNRIVWHPEWTTGSMFFDVATNSGGRISAAVDITSVSVITGTRSGANMEIRQNGSSLATKSTASGTASNTNNILLGANTASLNFLNGDVYELLIYNRGLSAEEISSVENYLNTKYSIY